MSACFSCRCSSAVYAPLYVLYQLHFSVCMFTDRYIVVFCRLLCISQSDDNLTMTTTTTTMMMKQGGRWPSKTPLDGEGYASQSGGNAARRREGSGQQRSVFAGIDNGPLCQVPPVR